MIAFSFFSLFAALTAVYLLFLFRMRSGLLWLASRRQEDARPATSVLPSLTVIVPMRNEQGDVADCIASLRAQDYPGDRMRVLLIDDHSEDDTVAAARAAIGEDERFHILHLGSGEAGKKDAITAGVRASEDEIIVTTDADCRHAPRWLTLLLQPFAEGADICAGPVIYERRDSLFARLQAMEFLGLVGVGAGFFGIGWPRLCNGANLAYRRSMFESVRGFDGNAGIPSGDDEFLLHKIVYREGGRAEFVTHADAVVRTEGAPGPWTFLRQRIRWASKARRYEDGRFVAFLVLLFVYFLFAAFAPLICLTSPVALGAGLIFFLLKLLGDGAVLVTAAELFRRPLRPLDLIVAEVLHPYYIVIVSLAGFFGMYSWKNRRLQNRKQISG